MDNFKFNIPGKPEYLTMIRLVTGSLASIAGFDIEAIEDIKSCISEACKIISCHGEVGFSEKYEININIDKHYMEIEIIDDCKNHSIKKVNKPCIHCPEEGNMGRIVIQSLMNSVDFSRDELGRKKVRMIKEF